MNARKKDSQSAQSARFREAAREAGGDQKSFEKAFKKMVPPKNPPTESKKKRA
jgi:hypothetical protein